MAVATLTSRVLGMVREMVYARFMGDGWVAGAFQLAFMIPNLFRRLLGEGALTAAFIPIFKAKERTDGEAEMWRAANAVISALILASSAVVRTVATRMIPGTLGVASYQINVLITQGIAFGVDASIVASFNYGVRLMELPQGLFGVSLATFLLPALSGLAAERHWDEFRRTLRQGLGHMLFVNLLASVLLVLLAEPCVRLLFERGQFGPGSTARVAFALACLAPGLVLFSAINICARAFYALGDTRTPMRISVLCLGLNVIFTVALLLLFPSGYKQGALGVANSLSAAVNAALLIHTLRRKIGRLDFGELWASLLPVLASGVLAGAVAGWGASLWTRNLGHATLWFRIGEVFGPATAAAAVYLLAAWWLRVPSAREMAALLRKRFQPSGS
jgi:putative peptidoglycan lipid II flippase